MLRLVRKPQRNGLAKELVQSLFCGLPRLERRVAVFLAAGDESDHPRQDGVFVYGGYVAPVLDWTNWFTPVWEERVLNQNPPIDHLHISTMRQAAWQEKNGFTPTQVEYRIDEAVRVIASSGSLHPITTSLDGGHFRRTFKGIKVAKPDDQQPGTYIVQPDFVGFQGFAINALHWVHAEYPDAERVDFFVERKQGVTHYLEVFREALIDGLQRDGRGHLVRLIGGLTPVDKDRVPVQAADLLMWHFRRSEEDCLEPIDLRRWGQLVDGRPWTRSSVTPAQVDGAKKRLLARAQVTRAASD